MPVAFHPSADNRSAPVGAFPAACGGVNSEQKTDCFILFSGGSGSSESFDVDKLDRSRSIELSGPAVDERIEPFKLVRQDTISIVRSVEDNDLDREGLHAFHRHGKLKRFICWANEHLRIYENDIREASEVK